MLIEPEALLMFSERAGLKLWRDGKILWIEFKRGGLSEEWKAVIRQNKDALMPIIPEYPAGLAGQPNKATGAPARENLDMFGPVPSQPSRTRAGKGRPIKATNIKASSPGSMMLEDKPKGETNPTKRLQHEQ